MFGLLNSSQIYGLPQNYEKSNNQQPTTPTAPKTITTSSSVQQHKTRRTSSNASDTGKESKFLSTLSSASQGMKSPTNFIEKFIKSELLNGYDTIKNYKNFHHSAKPGGPGHAASPHNTAGVIPSFSCLQGSYRSNTDGEFYEAINVSSGSNCMTDAGQQQGYQKLSDSDIDLPPTLLLASSGASSGEFNSDSTTANIVGRNNNVVGSSSGGGTTLFKKMQIGAKALKNLDLINGNANEIPSDNSSSSISTTTTNSSNTSSHNTSTKSNDLQRSSSSASSNIARPTGNKKLLAAASSSTTMTHRTSPEKSSKINANITSPLAAVTAASHLTSSTLTGGIGGVASTERSQRRKLMQMISNYDQQNKLLQRELAKEKRRRTEELACVVKSLICFESKLKTDMKSVNQRLQEKDAEICRLVRQNRALRKRLQHVKEVEVENAKDEGVGEEDLFSSLADGEAEEKPKQAQPSFATKVLEEDLDCLVLEALQCINCRKQFYDIELKESWTQTGLKDGSRQHDGHTMELGSSSDDTVSSSFYGARRSVRYTSKRTSGTFRDYMRSRSMHIDDDDDEHHLGNNSEENTSTISLDDSQRSYDKINIYSRTMERMHGVKSAIDGKGGTTSSNSEIAAVQDAARTASRASNKSTASSSSSNKSVPTVLIEEDDGIFSPTQDEDFEEVDDEVVTVGNEVQHQTTTKRRAMEFSEASPKQVYETSTDDWYASASDQDESSAAPKSYGQNAVNPVLECVNQILLQQSMEEPTGNSPTLRKSLESTPNSAISSAGAATTSNLPRRSSLSGRRSSRSNSHSSEGGGQTPKNGTLTRKRVHFSTKNSMVHVPRHDDHDDDDDDFDCERGTTPRSVTVDAILPPTSLAQLYHPMNYLKSQLVSSNKQTLGATKAASMPPNSVIYADKAVPQRDEHERLDTLNYESIYSNEYEPIGSEHNSSNLYVDMESTAKLSTAESSLETKLHKLPPALPPKPANLLKFKKSLQQLDEMPDEHLQQDDCGASTTTISEPDYCSISEVNMGGGMRSVQIVADVHKAPESEPDLEQQQAIGADHVELELEVSTIASVRSDDTCGAESQKTEEIEEIFADIPKLPNVAAIIAPKNSPKYPQAQPNDHYLIMSPKVDNNTALLKHKLSLNLTDISASNSANDYLHSSPRTQRSPKVETSPLSLQLGVTDATATASMRQYKRKHVPNILAEINKRMHNTAVPPNSPSTPTSKIMLPSPKAKPTTTATAFLQSPNSLPLLQAEFDWYNLDAEYGKSPSHGVSVASLQHTPDILKVTDNLGSAVVPTLLEEIQEDHESVVATADEYNLDEEFSLTSDKPDLVLGEQALEMRSLRDEKLCKAESYMSAICEAVNFPLFSESSPQRAAAAVTATSSKVNSKKSKKNLANFEKFIEGTGMSTKTLPSKRKIYFAGPFV